MTDAERYAELLAATRQLVRLLDDQTTSVDGPDALFNAIAVCTVATCDGAETREYSLSVACDEVGVTWPPQ